MRILFEKAPAAGTVINTGIIMMIFSGSIIRLDGFAKVETTRILWRQVSSNLLSDTTADNINGSSTLRDLSF